MHRQFPRPLRTPVTHDRRISGEILSATTTTSVCRIEMHSRWLRAPQVERQFCQPELTLFRHREGFHRMQGWIDGRGVNCDSAAGATDLSSHLKRSSGPSPIPATTAAMSLWSSSRPRTDEVRQRADDLPG